jgi:hypothetical protein
MRARYIIAIIAIAILAVGAKLIFISAQECRSDLSTGWFGHLPNA